MTSDETWTDEALGVVVVAGRAGSPGAVAWAGAWAAAADQALTVVEARPAGRDPERRSRAVKASVRATRAAHPGLVVRHRVVALGAEPLLAWASWAATSLVVDAEVAALVARTSVDAYPACPVLVLPVTTAPSGASRPDAAATTRPATRPPASDAAPVLLAVGGCQGCALPMGFAFAHADRIGAPLTVAALAEADDPDGSVARVRAMAAMFAGCYPGLAVTVTEPDSLAAAASGAQLVVTGVGHTPPTRGSQDDLRVLAGRPVALVPMAA